MTTKNYNLKISYDRINEIDYGYNSIDERITREIQQAIRDSVRQVLINEFDDGCINGFKVSIE